ncbi:lachesin-like [Planococcus citri]|uniref:lachesin-like n=1 Tax=Planococcus citri TaxID=170843 RepID=UPI0031F9118E
MIHHLALFVYLLQLVSSQNTPVPNIVEVSPVLVKDVNETVDLYCKVKDLRDASLLWGRQKGDRTTTLWGSGQKFVKDDRITVQTDNSTLFTSTTLRITNVQTKDAGTYRCSIPSENGEDVSRDITLQVRSPPFIFGNTSTSVNTSLNSSVTLECYGGGYPEPEVIWTRENNGVLPNGVTSYRGSTLKINNVQKDHAGNYYCTVDNKVSQSAKKTIRLEVEYPPIVKPRELRVGQALGYEAYLECTIESVPAVQITWLRDNIPISDSQYYTQTQAAIQEPVRSAVLKVKVTERKQYGSYTCVASSKIGKGAANIDLYQTEKENCARHCQTSSGHSIINMFDLKLGFTSVVVLMFQLHHM